MKNLVLGIDVGGTNVKLGIVDAKGSILARSVVSTKSYSRHPRDLVRAIFTQIYSLLKDSKIVLSQFRGIGIGLPGAVDPFKGLVIFLPNVPGWKNIYLRRIFEKEFNLPTFLENDVNMITLGEWKFGAGRGENDLVCMTLGTGVGGGLVLGGKMYRGEGFVAGEIGHMPINEDGPLCNCGGVGCFERYVGNARLLERISEIFGKNTLTIPDVHALAVKGDKKALQFFDETATHIGNGLVGVVNLLNPPLIIIGGGVSNNRRFLFPKINEVIQKRAMKVQAKMVRIVQAKLGDDAGIVGARVLLDQGVIRKL